MGPSVRNDRTGALAVPGLDLARLRGHLDRALPGGVAGPIFGELIAGGRSNLTYVITDGVSRWVLRRPPLGHVQATAHDMAREFRVMSAMRDTDVPVPGSLLLCLDPEILGAPFYVMEKVEGVVLRTREDTSALGPRASEHVAHELIDVLANLHLVDPASVGLGDFGRPEGYLTRQVHRWATQLAGSRSRELPGADELVVRLAASVPSSQRAAILHGDYRLDNVVIALDPQTGQPHAAQPVAAVLDWEMATVGDPLADLGLFTVYYDGLGGADNPVADGVAGRPGFPSATELCRRYADRAGLAVDALDWYVVFGYFKIAVILEGIHFRYRKGQTVGSGFEGIGAIVPPLIDRALAMAADSANPELARS